MLIINEIFRSIQGEGFFTGTPVIFIRLQGCNNGCEFCDTEHAQGADGGKSMSVWGVMEEVRELRKGTKIDRVVITGGEPFLQSEGLLELVHALYDQKINVSIESSGTVEMDNFIESVLVLSPESVDSKYALDRVYLTISPKKNPPLDSYIQRADEIKLLVAFIENDDLPIPELVRKMLDEEIKGKNTKQFYFQPIAYWYGDQELSQMKASQDTGLALVRAIDLCYKHGANLSVQLHKFLGIQ